MADQIFGGAVAGRPGSTASSRTAVQAGEPGRDGAALVSAEIVQAVEETYKKQLSELQREQRASARGNGTSGTGARSGAPGGLRSNWRGKARLPRRNWTGAQKEVHVDRC